MKIAILGFGKEGKSVFRFLKKSPRYNGADISILDKKRDERYLAHLDAFDLIVKSPGVPFTLPEVAKARASGALFTSATALFFDHAQGLIIGITGTKGKGTTATLLHKMLAACKKDTCLAGNIGLSMLDILPNLHEESITVLELSSFQLEHLLFSPRIAVVLDIFPDHLDAHASYKEYVAAKKGIVENQTKNDAVFFFEGSAEAEAIARQSKGKHLAIDPEAFRLFKARDLKMPGAHNYRNAVMAASVALYLGCDPVRVKKEAHSFKGLPYRLQRVRSVNTVSFYNDSAATNPHATAAAIMSFETPSILIAGGRDKGFPYDVLAKVAVKSHLRHVVAVGENAKILEKIFSKAGVPLTIQPLLDKAVEMAWRYCSKQQKGQEQWNIIFSPGATSFDQFENYKERGRAFNRIVKELKI